MCERIVLMFLFVVCAAEYGNEKIFQDNRRLSQVIVEALQDTNFDSELTYDLKKENQVYLNRTMSLLIKYIVKREVDNYRTRRADAIGRKVYSALIMKLIDIAKDIPRNTSYAHRIDTAHRYYMSVESRDLHDEIADRQVFHACARLYDILLTAPQIITQLGKLDDLTPRTLVRKLEAMDVKTMHLAVLLIIQYHLRKTANYAVQSNVVSTLSAEPQSVGMQVINTLKVLAAYLLPVAELLDVHLSHSSALFRNTCPATWLGIVNNK